MVAIIVRELTIDNRQCDGHMRMRGMTSTLRELLDVVTPAAILDRYISRTESDGDIDNLWRSVRINKLRKQLQAG